MAAIFVFISVYCVLLEIVTQSAKGSPLFIRRATKKKHITQ